MGPFKLWEPEVMTAWYNRIVTENAWGEPFVTLSACEEESSAAVASYAEVGR